MKNIPEIAKTRLISRKLYKFNSYKEYYFRLEHLFGSESPTDFPFAWSKQLDHLVLESKNELRGLPDTDFMSAIGIWQEFLDQVLSKFAVHDSARVMQKFVDDGCLKMHDTTDMPKNAAYAIAYVYIEKTGGEGITSANKDIYGGRHKIDGHDLYKKFNLWVKDSKRLHISKEPGNSAAEHVESFEQALIILKNWKKPKAYKLAQGDWNKALERYKNF
jgi:hypothetical protein